jgi:hypothetical protein
VIVASRSSSFPKKDFDPQAFAQKLAFTDDWRAWHQRRRRHQAPDRLHARDGLLSDPYKDGSISGLSANADGQIKMPPAWIRTNVVNFAKKSA